MEDNRSDFLEPAIESNVVYLPDSMVYVVSSTTEVFGIFDTPEAAMEHRRGRPLNIRVRPILSSCLEAYLNSLGVHG